MTLYDQLAAMPAQKRDTLLSSLGYTKKRAAPVRKASPIDRLFPRDGMSFGGSTPELEAWMAKRHDQSFRIKYRAPTLGKPPKLSPGRYQEEETRWNDAARRAWKERGIEA